MAKGPERHRSTEFNDRPQMDSEDWRNTLNGIENDRLLRSWASYPYPVKRSTEEDTKDA